jgi:hypothetical protein
MIFHALGTPSPLVFCHTVSLSLPDSRGLLLSIVVSYRYSSIKTLPRFYGPSSPSPPLQRSTPLRALCLFTTFSLPVYRLARAKVFIIGASGYSYNVERGKEKRIEKTRLEKLSERPRSSEAGSKRGATCLRVV